GLEPLGVGEGGHVGRHPAQGGLVEAHDVEVLTEVGYPEGGGEAGGAGGGQHVVHAGHVVADGGGGELAAEHRPGVPDEGHEGRRVGVHELEVLGGDDVDHLHGLLRPVDEDDGAAAAQGGLDVGPAGRLGQQTVDRLGHV